MTTNKVLMGMLMTMSQAAQRLDVEAKFSFSGRRQLA